MSRNNQNMMELEEVKGEKWKVKRRIENMKELEEVRRSLRKLEENWADKYILQEYG